jgi:hypothetical protein
MAIRARKAANHTACVCGSVVDALQGGSARRLFPPHCWLLQAGFAQTIKEMVDTSPSTVESG